MHSQLNALQKESESQQKEGKEQPLLQHQYCQVEPFGVQDAAMTDVPTRRVSKLTTKLICVQLTNDGYSYVFFD